MTNDDDDDDDNFTSTPDQEANHIVNARARYNLSMANLKYTAPLYKKDLFPLLDGNEQPVICLRSGFLFSGGYDSFHCINEEEVGCLLVE